MHPVFRGLLILAGILGRSRALPAPAATAAQPIAPPWAAKTTVALSLATIVGSSFHSVDTFAGIPYARPPTGPLRLRPPRPLASPLGVVDATGIAPGCPQMLLSTGSKNILLDVFAEALALPIFNDLSLAQEDCLTVTVRRPAGTAADAKLPVLFWIFGGGFELGSTSSYDGSALVRNGAAVGMPFLFVAVNYRTGGFGFMPGREILADGAANLGLLDQRLGLEWVADNIAAFGGDPDRVTIWGESAGAMSVLDQMVLYGGDNSYGGKPLFRGAIMNSGSIAPADPVDGAKGQATYDAVVAEAGCSSAADTLACLRGLDYPAFLHAANSVPGIVSYEAVALSYLPRPDGDALPDSPDVLVASGRYAAVPMIIGDQEDEGTVFALFQPNLTTTERLAAYLSDLYFRGASAGQMEALVATYDPAISDGSPFGTGLLNELYPGFKRRAAVLGDLVFTLARRLFLDLARRANPDVPAWSYLASYGHGTPFLGTFHGSDLLRLFYGSLPNHAGRAVQAHYVNFLYNLDPNVGVTGLPSWPRWSHGKQLMRFFRNGAGLLADDFRSDSYDWIASHGDILRF